MQHHEDTLDAYVRRVQADPNAIAVILVGSVARGTERPDSDVDVYLIVRDHVFDSALAADRVIFVERSDATYAGGYVDDGSCCVTPPCTRWPPAGGRCSR